MKTRFMGVLLVAVLALAAVPQAWGVVEDPFYKVMEPYGYDPDRHDQTVEQAYERTVSALKAKPESELTAAEADWLGDGYRTRNGLTQDLDKAKHYYLLATDKDPEYAPVYVGLATLYKGEREYQKALRAYDQFILLNPDGAIENYRFTAWSWLGYTLMHMDSQGYNVPDDLPGQFMEIEENGWNEGLETREDLKKIGYLRIREKHLIPLMQEEKPYTVAVSQGVTDDTYTQAVMEANMPYILVGAALAIVLMLAIVLKVGAWVTRR